MRDTPTHDRGLNRHLGLLSVTALVIGEVIAVGIFLTPAGMGILGPAGDTPGNLPLPSFRGQRGRRP